MIAEDAATKLVVPAEDEYNQVLLTLHFLELKQQVPPKNVKLN